MQTIRARRRELGITQRRLAEISGVSQPIISRVERNEQRLREVLNIGKDGL